MNLAQRIVIGALRVYRAVVSPVWSALASPWGLGCRFTPTCSQYAVEAVSRHGTVKGLGLALRRLSRCHPWGPWGYDPVPDRLEPVDAEEFRRPACPKQRQHPNGPARRFGSGG
jgi:putative membrane protein insertion efficiency factor